MTIKDAVTEAGRLTDRDHHVITLLAQHQVMSSEQLARVVFPNIDRARHRLLKLAERGVLDRFHRLYERPGERPWYYTLGWLGALIHTAGTDTDMALPRPSDTARRVLRLQRSPSLSHLLGVNEFFSLLHAAARRDRSATLTAWWPEATAAEACGGVLRPDGYGEWTEHTDPQPTHHPGTHRERRRVSVGFFYEHDTGTEQLSTLLGKIDKYSALAAADITAPVLIHLPGTRRETHLHHAITQRYGPHGPTALIATTSTEHLSASEYPATHAGRVLGPAGPIWWPATTTGRRVPLALLTNHHHRQLPR